MEPIKLDYESPFSLRQDALARKLAETQSPNLAGTIQLSRLLLDLAIITSVIGGMTLLTISMASVLYR